MGAIRPIGVRSRVMIPGQRAFFPQNRFFPRNRFVFNRFNRFRHGRFFFNNNCFNSFGSFGGFGCGSPFLSGGFGFPFVDPFFDSGFYDSGLQQPQQQPVVAENQGDDRAGREMAFEVQALRDEIQAMRDEDRARNEARNSPPSRPSAPSDSENVVLVFRDGRQLSAHNYAITDHTIWVLNPNNARKYSVADLDVQATEQANAKNGVEFHLPRQ